MQTVIEMLQTELGRVMGCCGTPSLAAISRAHVKVHAPVPPGRTDVDRPGGAGQNNAATREASPQTGEKG